MANATRLPAVRDQAKPRKLGRYELEECLGAEAGIDTFRARVRGLAGFDRIFAVKCHRRGRGSALNLNDPFIRVAKRTAALNDARVARVLDADVIDGVAIVVTEFVHGLDLDRFREWAQSSGVLATGSEQAALKWQKIVAYVGGEIAGALASLHALSPPLIHGGLSPRNVIATARGGIKLLDVGLRRSAQPPEDGSVPRAFSYAAAAEWLAEPTAKGDVHALGALLFELLTGEPPPTGMGSSAAHKILTALWPAMADFLAGLLSEDPASRPSAAEVAKTLGEFWSDVPDASMVAEMTSLVRNFSAFVADGASPQTPSPVAVEYPSALVSESTVEETEILAPAPTVVASVPVIPPGAKATSTSGSFLAVPEDPTRLAVNASYANALFEALDDPTISASPPLHAPVEAMAAEIQAADLVSSIALEGLPPNTDEPVALGSGEVMVDDLAPVVASPTTTGIDPVPVPEAADWGAQALAALAGQAGVEIAAEKAPSPVSEANEADAPAARTIEVPPFPVDETVTEESFAASPRAAVVVPEDPLGFAAKTPADDGKRTLLFAGTSGGVANLEDELVDEPSVAETSPVVPAEEPEALGGQPFQPAETEPPVAQAFTSLSSDALPAEAFEPPAETYIGLERAPSGDADDIGFAADAGPALVPSALAAEEEPAIGSGFSEPRLAHAMSASGERVRKPVTRTAKKSAETMLAQASEDMLTGSSRRRKIVLSVMAALVLVGAAAAAVVSFGPQLRTRGRLPALGKATPSSAAKPAPLVAPSAKTPVTASTPAPARAPAAAAVPASAQPAPSGRAGSLLVPIASTPAGSTVWIDGEERCKTPCSVKLARGSSRIAVVHAGYRTGQSTVDVSDGAKVDMTLEAVEPPMSGDARFRAECATRGKLPIVVDGRETGILCPFSKMRVEPGTHTIGVLIPSTGKIHSKELTLSSGVRSVSFGD